MIDAYLAAMRHYAVFSGRAPRGEYWWFQLSLAMLILVSLGIERIAFDPESAGTLAVLVYLAHVLPIIALEVRRLHDIDRSGWFVLVALVPLVGPIALLVWFCERGTRGDNRFGPDSLAMSAGITAASTRPLAAAARDVVADIERLAGLRAGGTLSEPEFEVLKAQVMAGTAQA